MSQRTFSQPQLVSAILKWLDEHGVKAMHSRQLNAVIAAADGVIEALDRPYFGAEPGMGLAAWRASDDTGLSSLYLADALTGSDPGRVGTRYPHDPADFGRCVRLLEAAPDLRVNLDRLVDPMHGPVWNALGAAWAELEALYREEVPTGRCPRLYERIYRLIGGAV